MLLLGDSGAGKTCLLLRHANNMFSETFITTIGIDFKIKFFRHKELDYKVIWWDTAGQERFRSVTTSYIKGAQGILLVLDVTNPNAIANMERWIEDVVARAPNGV
jgi:small GTP-binding protein